MQVFIDTYQCNNQSTKNDEQFHAGSVIIDLSHDMSFKVPLMHNILSNSFDFSDHTRSLSQKSGIHADICDVT